MFRNSKKRFLSSKLISLKHNRKVRNQHIIVMLGVLFLNSLLFKQRSCNILLNLSCHINALKTKYSFTFQKSLKNICSHIAYQCLCTNCYSYLCNIASLFVTCHHFFENILPDPLDNQQVTCYLKNYTGINFHSADMVYIVSTCNHICS